MSQKKFDTNKLTAMAVLTALIIVLQVLSTFVKFGPINITLALTPIVIGAALYGPWAGAFLGCVMGAVVFVMGLLGLDGGFVIYLITENFQAFEKKISYNVGDVLLDFIFVMLLCLLKSTLAGLISGLIYKGIAKGSKSSDSVATLLAAIACPVINTGIFAIGAYFLFNADISGMALKFAQTPDTLGYLILTLIGINFVVEFIVNVVLSSAIARIIKAVSKNKI